MTNKTKNKTKNVAVSIVSGSMFEFGKEYTILSVIDNTMVEVKCKGTVVTLPLNDPDFIFIFNKPTNFNFATERKLPNLNKTVGK